MTSEGGGEGRGEEGWEGADLVDDGADNGPLYGLDNGWMVDWLEPLDDRLHNGADQLLHRSDGAYDPDLWADHGLQRRLGANDRHEDWLNDFLHWTCCGGHERGTNRACTCESAVR